METQVNSMLKPIIVMLVTYLKAVVDALIIPWLHQECHSTGVPKQTDTSSECTKFYSLAANPYMKERAYYTSLELPAFTSNHK